MEVIEAEKRSTWRARRIAWSPHIDDVLVYGWDGELWEHIVTITCRYRETRSVVRAIYSLPPITEEMQYAKRTQRKWLREQLDVPAIIKEIRIMNILAGESG